MFLLLIFFLGLNAYKLIMNLQMVSTYGSIVVIFIVFPLNLPSRQQKNREISALLQLRQISPLF